MTNVRPLRAAALGALGVLLVWLVASTSLVEYLAVTAPETALRIRPDHPRALVGLAEKQLEAARPPAAPAPAATPGPSPTPPAEDKAEEPAPEAKARLSGWSRLASEVDAARPARDKADAPPSEARLAPEQLRARLERALTRDPLNARAMRMLGQLAEAAGNETAAAGFMRAAVRRSPRESLAVYWLMQKSYRDKDYRAALVYADTLLRTRAEVIQVVIPTLARIAETPAARDDLKEVLASNPPWRAHFFSALPGAITDARTPLEYLLAVRETPTPPTMQDLRDYLNILLRHKLYDLAYYAWLQFLQPEQLNSAGLLFNGGFELAPSGLPFDWTLRSGTGATVDITTVADQPDRRALLVELGPGRVEFGTVTQMVLLAPGPYQLKGKYKGELVGRRGLSWRITCAGSDNPLGQSTMVTGTVPRWRDMEISFTVPDTDCRAQQLSLHFDARSASEQLVYGTVWYDDLQIQPLN